MIYRFALDQTECTSYFLFSNCKHNITSLSLLVGTTVALQKSCLGREKWLLTLITFMMFCDCRCRVALYQGAVGRSAVCDCGISLSYFRTFL